MNGLMWSERTNTSIFTGLQISNSVDMISRMKEWIGNRFTGFDNGCKVQMWVQRNHEWNVWLSSMFRDNHGL